MNIDPKYKNLVHTDASALLRPKTGLKDMFIELNPGTANAPIAKQGYTIPVNDTNPDINPDEILAVARRRYPRVPGPARQRRRPGAAGQGRLRARAGARAVPADPS